MGFLAAEGSWVVNFDIDYFSADFLKRVIALDEVDLVIASKRDPDSEDRRPLLRRVATWVFNLLLRSILDSRVSDTHGMKAFATIWSRRWPRPFSVARSIRHRAGDPGRAGRLSDRGGASGGGGDEGGTVVAGETRPRTIRGLLRIRRTLADESLGLAPAHTPDSDAD